MPPRASRPMLTIFASRRPCQCFLTYAEVTTTATSTAEIEASTRKLLVGRRTFTSTSCRFASLYSDYTDQSARRKARKMPSTKMQMNKEIETSTTPNDIGLLPETFIMPTGKNLPSIVYEPRKRWKLEWKRMKSSLQNFFMLIVYKYGDALRPRPSLELRQRSKIARELYELMNQALAEKDITTLRSICADGLFDSIRTRISWRNPKEHLYWSLTSTPSTTASLPLSTSSASSVPSPGILHRLFSKNPIKASIVSDRAAPLPYPHSPAKGPKNRIRQVVVRLESAQRLVRWRWADKHEHEHSSASMITNTNSNTEPTASPNEHDTEHRALQEIKREIFGQHFQHSNLQNLEPAEQIEILGVTGFPRPLATTEYLVLQQQLLNGLQEPWIVWGNAEETGLEVVQKWERGHVGDVDEGVDDKKAGIGKVGA